MTLACFGDLPRGLFATERPALRILIVDQEYLVAMEVERILQDVGGYKVRIAMSWELPVALNDEMPDIILIDSALADDSRVRPLLINAGASIVLLSFRASDLSGVPAWPGAPVIAKPFDDDQVIRAVQDAVRARATP
jgi:DNA-binding NarL/FixJ family response regulator